MNGWRAIVFATALVGAEIGGLALCAHRNVAPWAEVGLMCIVPLYAVGIGAIFGLRALGSRNLALARAVLTATIVGLLSFWAYSFVWVLSKSVLWAVLATTAVAVLVADTLFHGLAVATRQQIALLAQDDPATQRP